jgi:hypothetical protein
MPIPGIATDPAESKARHVQELPKVTELASNRRGVFRRRTPRGSSSRSIAAAESDLAAMVCEFIVEFDRAEQPRSNGSSAWAATRHLQIDVSTETTEHLP